MADLDFLVDPKGFDLRSTAYFSGKRNFWKLKNDDVPAAPGAYVLLARGKRFPYPNGTSPVYYIGQSGNLKRRLLRVHLKYAEEARDGNRKRHLYWPRYEYAARFGMHCCWVRTWQGLTPKSLEDNLMTRFALKHRSFPVANGAGSWRRVARLAEQ